MKKIFLLGMLTFMFFLGGCGRKEEKKKQVASIELDKNAMHSSVNLAENKFTDEFAEERFDAEELAFLDEEFLDEELLEIEAEEFAEVHQAYDEEYNERLESDEDKDLAVWNEEIEKFKFKTLNFAFNEATLDKDQDKILEENVAVARAAIEEGKIIIIQGHADELGSDAANSKISMQRAEETKNKMLEFELPADKLEVVSFSNEIPIAWSDSEEKGKRIEDLSPNRRVDFSVSVA